MEERTITKRVERYVMKYLGHIQKKKSDHILQKTWQVNGKRLKIKKAPCRYMKNNHEENHNSVKKLQNTVNPRKENNAVVIVIKHKSIKRKASTTWVYLGNLLILILNFP